LQTLLHCTTLRKAEFINEVGGGVRHVQEQLEQSAQHHQIPDGQVPVSKEPPPKRSNPLAALLWSILYAVIFVGSQIVAGFVLVYGCALFVSVTAITRGTLNPDDPSAVMQYVLQAAATEFTSIMPWALLVSGILALLACWLIVKVRGFDARRFAGLNPVRPSVVVAALLLGIGFSMAFNSFFNMPGLEVLQDYETSLAQSLLFGSVLMAIVGSTVVPIVEEIIFRGFVLSELRRGIALLPSALLSSVLFGILHGTLAWGIMAATLGILMAWIALRARSVWAAIAAHIGINGATFTFVWSDPSGRNIFIALLIAGLVIFTVNLVLLIRDSRSLKDLDPAPEPLSKPTSPREQISEPIQPEYGTASTIDTADKEQP